jgi:hypothetical protein
MFCLGVGPARAQSEGQGYRGGEHIWNTLYICIKIEKLNLWTLF